jgi:hypothetical protein
MVTSFYPLFMYLLDLLHSIAIEVGFEQSKTLTLSGELHYMYSLWKFVFMA